MPGPLYPGPCTRATWTLVHMPLLVPVALILVEVDVWQGHVRELEPVDPHPEAPRPDSAGLEELLANACNPPARCWASLNCLWDRHSH